MRATRVDAVDTDPGAACWDGATAETVALEPVPTGAVDTSAYVRETVDTDEIGAVDAVDVAVVTDGEHLGVELGWRDPSADDAVDDIEDFCDKAAVAFPVEPGCSVMTMGSERAPMNAWYWRADRSAPYDVVARGFGETERSEGAVTGLTARGSHDGDGWTVRFRRRLEAPAEDRADLRGATGIAVAVWQGSNAERGPLKAYSGEFRSLRMEGT